MTEIIISFDDEELEDVKTTLPESWEEITVELYQKLFSKSFTDLPVIQQTLHIVSSLTNLSEDIILSLPIERFKTIVDKIKYIYEEIPNENVEFITIEDENYYLYTDYSQLTTGEIISLDTILETNKNNINKCLSDILCIFLRKKKPNGKLERFSTLLFERKEMFSKLQITQVYHLIIFFLDGGTTYKPNTKDYMDDNKN